MPKLDNWELWAMVMDYALTLCAEIDRETKTRARIKSIDDAVELSLDVIKLEKKLGYSIELFEPKDRRQAMFAIDTGDDGGLTIIPSMMAGTLFTTYEITSRKVFSAAVHVSIMLATIQPQVPCTTEARDSVLSMIVYYLASCGLEIPDFIGFGKHLEDFQKELNEAKSKASVTDEDGFVVLSEDFCS